MIDARPRPGLSNMNKRTAAPDFEHGLRRADDGSLPRDPQPQAAPPREPQVEAPIRRPTGLPLLLLVALGLLTAAGVVQVRARARVLELGAEIAEMTGEHSGLLDQRRRLEAERAFLRHPDYIHQVAETRLQMVPAAPERVQTIRLQPDPKTLANGTGPKGHARKTSQGAAP